MNMTSSRVYSAPVPKMPPGLVEIMEGLARDVLKNNPIDVYEFCAEHMQRLLQIRDGPITKVTPTLEQKVAKATEKIRDRAAHRRDEFDKKMRLIQNIESDQLLNDDPNKKNNTEAEQYKQENIVKVPQNQLTGNIEHELIAGETEELFLSKQVDVIDTNISEASDLKPEDDINLKNGSPNVYVESVEQEHNKEVEVVSSESELKENTDDNDIEEILLENKDELKSSKEDQKEENGKSEEKQSDLIETKTKTNANDDILVPDNNSDDKVHDNILIDVIESVDFKETCNEVENSNINDIIIMDEHSDVPIDNITNAEINQEKGDTNKVDDDIVKMTEDENTSSIENISKSDMVLKEEILEEPGDEHTKSTNKYNLDTNDISVDQTENTSKNKYGESHGHINNNSMDLETAAITIQKVFRSFLFRNKTSSIDDSTNIYMNLLIEDKEKKNDEVVSNNIIKDRRSLGISRMDTALQTVNEEKSLSLSTDDSSTLSSAATIIQAHVRGFLVRNNFNHNKTVSSTSGIDSDAQSMTSLEGDVDCHKSKTVLNIHIIPEGGHYMSRDESMLTSMDLSLDGSPPNSTNLHPLGYDKSERRKQLKREDAIQSISPPSNNSGKLSEDIDSVKEVLNNSDNDSSKSESLTAYDGNAINIGEAHKPKYAFNDDDIPTMINNVETQENRNIEVSAVNKSNQVNSLPQMNSDEMDVVTPFVTIDGTVSSDLGENDTKLIHSGEFHDVVLPTKVSRNDTSVVRGE